MLVEIGWPQGLLWILAAKSDRGIPVAFRPFLHFLALFPELL
jgi:hypothetical protein